MQTKKYTSLKAFYPFYLTEHRSPISRALHFVGTGLFITLFISAFLTQNWIFLLYCPIVGYGFAWIGHFFFEKNKPATFQYPLYSLASDFIMFYHMITFQIGKKMHEANNCMARDFFSNNE